MGCSVISRLIGIFEMNKSIHFIPKKFERKNKSDQKREIPRTFQKNALVFAEPAYKGNRQ